MNKTGVIAKISIRYVLPTCIWKYFWQISRYFAFFLGISRDFAETPEFRGSATARNIRSPAFMIVFSSKPGYLSSKSVMYANPKELGSSARPTKTHLVTCGILTAITHYQSP